MRLLARKQVLPTILAIDFKPDPITLFKTFNKPLALNKLNPSTLDYHIRNSLHQLHIDPLSDPLPHMITLPQKYRERAYRNILRTTISTIGRMELLHLARTCPTMIVERLPTFTLPETTSTAVIFSNLHKTFAPTLTNYPYSAFAPKLPPTSHPTSTYRTTTHTPSATNAIAPLAFPSRSWVMKPTPYYTVPTLSTSPILPP